MANLTETAVYDAGVYQIETTDPVSGGATGIANKPLINLANRTAFLKGKVDGILAGTETLSGYAKLASPTFTGNPVAPTPALGDRDTSIATTDFVQKTLGGVLSKSVAGGVNVTLTAVEAGNGILVFTGALTASISVIVPTAPTRPWVVFNNTTGAFTLTVKTASGTGVLVPQGKREIVYCDGTNVASAFTDFVDVALEGVPTAPTAATGTNTTQLATTAFVNAEIANDAAPKSHVGATGAAHGVATTSVNGFMSSADKTKLNAVASGAAAVGSTAGAALAAFGSAGTATTAARSDHTHPFPTAANVGAAPTSHTHTIANVTDWPAAVTMTEVGYLNGVTSAIQTQLNGKAASSHTHAAYAPLADPVFTGNPTAPTPSQFDNDTSIATTAFVRKLGLMLNGVTDNPTSGALTAAHAGATVGVDSNIRTTVQLPLDSNIPVGTVFHVIGVIGVGKFNVYPPSGGYIAIGSTNLGTNIPVTLNMGDGAFFIKYSDYVYEMMGGISGDISNFNKLFSNPGFQRFPNGLIIQWGYLVNTSNQMVINYPIAFPTAMLGMPVFGTVNSANEMCLVTVKDYSTSAFILNFYRSPPAVTPTWAPAGTVGVSWMAMGY